MTLDLLASLPFRVLDTTLVAFEVKPIVAGIVMALFVISALLLVLVILIQEGKGGGIAGAFGGAAAETFGVKAGSVNRFTALLATVFCLLALLHCGLADSGESVVPKEKKLPAVAPDVPSTPSTPSTPEPAAMGETPPSTPAPSMSDAMGETPPSTPPPTAPPAMGETAPPAPDAPMGEAPMGETPPPPAMNDAPPAPEPAMDGTPAMG